MNPKINDLFTYCNDISTMRNFYSNVLGMEEAWFDDGENETGNQYLGYKLSNGQTWHFIHRDLDFEVVNEWSYQPSSEIKNTSERFSVTLEFEKKEFEKVEKKILQSDIPHYQDNADIRNGYTALTVRDPMGLTIDLFYNH